MPRKPTAKPTAKPMAAPEAAPAPARVRALRRFKIPVDGAMRQLVPGDILEGPAATAALRHPGKIVEVVTE